MSNFDSFSTKRGSASFKENKIVFSGSAIGYYKSIYKDYWKSGSAGLRLIFFLIVLSFPSAFYAILSILSMSNGYSIVTAVFGLVVLIFVIQYIKGFRSPNKIELDSIENVSYTRGMKLMTRPRFIIKYTDDNKTYKRRVNMSSLYTESAEEELETAKEAFRQRGLL
jgi:hypothetical protein